MPRRFLVLVAALVGLVLLGGCTTVVTGSPTADPAPPPTEGPGSDPVAYADRVCSALRTFLVSAQDVPDFSAASDLAAIQATLSGYLGAVQAGAAQSRAELAEVGRSPVAGGDEAVTRLDGVLRQLEEDFGTAKATVDSADPNNQEAFLATITEAERLLNEINAPDALADLGALPRLDRAADEAPACQELEVLSQQTPG